MPIEKGEEDTSTDERAEEVHEEYNESIHSHSEEDNGYYSKSEILHLQINSKNKMSSIKKILLDKKKLKRANVIFYRQNKPGLINTMP